MRGESGNLLLVDAIAGKCGSSFPSATVLPLSRPRPFARLLALFPVAVVAAATAHTPGQPDDLCTSHLLRRLLPVDRVRLPLHSGHRFQFAAAIRPPQTG